MSFIFVFRVFLYIRFKRWIFFRSPSFSKFFLTPFFPTPLAQMGSLYMYLCVTTALISFWRVLCDKRSGRRLIIIVVNWRAQLINNNLKHIGNREQRERGDDLRVAGFFTIVSKSYCIAFLRPQTWRRLRQKTWIRVRLPFWPYKQRIQIFFFSTQID